MNPPASSSLYANPVAEETCPGFWAVGFPPPPPNNEQADRATDPPSTNKRALKEYFMLVFDLKELLI
jgi:hypothetical protein